MTARPLVTVFNANGCPSKKTIPLPEVLSCPVRADLVNIVHTNMAKNRRQPYAVSEMTGHQTSAESWGTGRAVARIPRVPGGGTHRAGQAAYGNMVRGGRMFAPTQIWRRWHRHVNVTMKRHAVCSALAASAIPALVAARGHRISKVAEVPLVVDAETVKNINKTKQIVAVLKKLHAYDDVEKVARSKKIRAGRGKMRDRRYTMRRGPLVIFKTRTPLIQALRNLPGVDLMCVMRPNLLQLAPGGHLGRFVIWLDDAFAMLDKVFGTFSQSSKIKRGYRLPRPVMNLPDIKRILTSENVKAALHPSRKVKKAPLKRNPLRNLLAMAALNPFAIQHRRHTVIQNRLLHEKRILRRRALARKRMCYRLKKAGKPVPVAPKKPLAPGKKAPVKKTKAEMKAHNKKRRLTKKLANKAHNHLLFNKKHKKERRAFQKFLFA